MSQPITAWLSIGSTYSYLTALRINAIQREMGLSLVVRPICIGDIMRSIDNIPFPPSKKTKVDYMWRDIERRADWYGLPKPKLPAPYPLQAFDQANEVGIVLNQQGRYLSILRRPTVFGLCRAWRLAHSRTCEKPSRP